MTKHTLRPSAGALAVLAFQSTAVHAEMTLTSDTLIDGGDLPLEHVADQFGCEGSNISPSLYWTGAPDGTQSYIVLVFDPDAPTASGWWHWGAYNISRDVNEIPAGAGAVSPSGRMDMIQVRNDFSMPRYVGACPPENDEPHRYEFSVFAMPMETLPVEQPVSPALLSFFATNYALGSASLTVTYGR